MLAGIYSKTTYQVITCTIRRKYYYFWNDIDQFDFIFSETLPYMKLRFRTIKIILAVILFLNCLGEAFGSDPPFLQYLHHPWVDSVLNSLMPDERIAQCIWIAAYSNRDIAHEVEVSDIIRKHGIGGIIFFQGTPEKQVELANFYQKISKVPLIYAMDAEWGVGMRLENVEKFPFQMTLGAIRNDSSAYRLGKAVAEQCLRTGININLAPVADINNNAENPVINYRSFGEDRENVANKSIMYVKGLQDHAVMATAKHFPGHGDTDVDSHYDLPVIKQSQQRLDSVELYPFIKLIEGGTGCIMTAHLNLPSLDTTTNLPSSLSPLIIKELLRNRLGFEGLIITDAMNMKGVNKFFRPGEAEAVALAAGNDVIEFVTDVEAALKEIRKLIEIKKITSAEIDDKCRKILALKYWSGLDKAAVTSKEKISEELNLQSTRALIREFYADALTVLNNEQNIIPLRHPEEIRIATVAVNRTGITMFQKRITDYHPTDNFFVDLSDSKAAGELLARLQNYDLVIAGVYGTSQRPDRNFGITTGLITFLGDLVGKNKTIITWFGNPYALDRIRSLEDSEGIILTYQENDFTEDLSAQLIFGGTGARGWLPVTINERWPCNTGILTPGNLRMQYGYPESAGMDSGEMINTIDSIVSSGLDRKAFPGCQIMVARKGIVVFNKAYGFHTYENRTAVRDDDLFDLASVTKIAATLPGLMLLENEGKFSSSESLGHYLPYFKKKPAGDLKLDEIMAHQAGFTAWIPFWKKTIKKNGEYKRSIYRPVYSDKFSLQVADGLYIKESYRKKVLNEIRNSPIKEKKFLYSDLGFIIAPEIIENLTGERWNDFVSSNIYSRTGIYDMGFNPREKYPLSRIIPTEYDSLFRKQLLHGTVHDEGASVLGGISGHAGLFATANDLMKLMELYRRMGCYGGEQIISRAVLEKYTSARFPENNNRRGLGFDKPLLNNSEVPGKSAYPAKSASSSSFGHSGFTGTFVWVDPEYELTYIFLSNRVYPTRDNNKLSEMNIRTNILQAAYDAVKRKK